MYYQQKYLSRAKIFWHIPEEHSKSATDVIEILSEGRKVDGIYSTTDPFQSSAIKS